jgi:CcmD family protein
MENAGYLFAAFAIVWAVTFAYILLLLNRQRRIQREIESLKKLVEEKS